MRRTIWIAFLLWACITAFCDASWGTPGTGQYHIQTDEGPERYFRFQTDNGQYRKEKRLQDGTVIGTDAWIDAAGYLRQKDYIADKKGYRILKSKTVYVGQGRQIEDAIRSVKGTPAQSGILVDSGLSQASNNVAPIQSTTAKPIYVHPSTTTTTTTTAPPALKKQGYLSPQEAASIPPSPYLGYDHYPAPEVVIRPHSQPYDNNVVPDGYYPPASSSTESVPIPSDGFEPPYEDIRKRVKPIGVASTTPSPITVSDAIEYSHSSTTENYPAGYSYSSPSPFSIASTTSAPEDSSSTPSPIQSNDYYDPFGLNTYSSSTERPYSDYSTPNGDLLPPTRRRRPSYRSRNEPLVYNNNLGSGYEDQYSEYDGIAVTRNGFRYYLPRQYHEEENVAPQKRAGSFGYIDPFGIRRIIYYNASPENGFVHRKNNRFVGFQATPYDPRP